MAGIPESLSQNALYPVPVHRAPGMFLRHGKPEAGML
jgi:hypothetical protein